MTSQELTPSNKARRETGFERLLWTIAFRINGRLGIAIPSLHFCKRLP
jgi:hypothetical protein